MPRVIIPHSRKILHQLAAQFADYEISLDTALENWKSLKWDTHMRKQLRAKQDTFIKLQAAKLNSLLHLDGTGEVKDPNKSNIVAKELVDAINAHKRSCMIYKNSLRRTRIIPAYHDLYRIAMREGKMSSLQHAYPGCFDA